MNNVATIEKIRQALRHLRNAVESKGTDSKQYGVALGISFAPAKGLSADELVESVQKNKKISPDLVYGMQAGLKVDPASELTKTEVMAKIEAFEAMLALLPQDLGAGMALDFIADSRKHEQEIIQEAQKAISAIEVATPQDVQKIVTAKG